ncbi:hypothetical protein HDU82_003882, partial [Entophlyctis luteolus]
MTAKIFCALSSDTNLTGFHVDFDVSLTVSDLKDAIRAKKMQDLGHLDADKLTLVRIWNGDVGGLTQRELNQSKEFLSLKTYGDGPEYGDDTVSPLRTAPGACKAKYGFTFKIMNSMKKVSFFFASLPEELFHVLVLVPIIKYSNLAPANLFMANLSSVPTTDSFAISIWNAMEDGKKLLIIPCGSSGRAWTRVQLFLSSVCGDFDPSCYSLKTANETNTAVTDLYLNELDILLPGRYYLIPKEGVQPLDVIYEPFPIIPKGKNSRLTSGSSSSIGSSSSATKKRTHMAAILNDVDDSVLVDGVAEVNNRTTLFEQGIIARDNHCVITKEYASTQAAHILAHSWWGDFESRKDLLPQSIRDAVSELKGGINSVRNGILLRTDLAA